MYPNLEYLIRIAGITKRSLADALGMCRNSVSNKLHGHTQWKEREMLTVQSLLAPSLPLETIFSPKFTLYRRKKA